MENTNIPGKDITKLIKDVAQIKQMLLAQKEKDNVEEKELTEWAKNELEQARKNKDKLSSEEVKSMILTK